jgi:hypothetical protein
MTRLDNLAAERQVAWQAFKTAANIAVRLPGRLAALRKAQSLELHLDENARSHLKRLEADLCDIVADAGPTPADGMMHIAIDGRLISSDLHAQEEPPMARAAKPNRSIPAQVATVPRRLTEDETSKLFALDGDLDEAALVMAHARAAYREALKTQRDYVRSLRKAYPLFENGNGNGSSEQNGNGQE